jgi:lauroyl/myristoyl acyltransferase
MRTENERTSATDPPFMGIGDAALAAFDDALESPEAAARRIGELSDYELQSLGVSFFEFGLTALFRGTWQPEAIRIRAAAVVRSKEWGTWTHDHYCRALRRFLQRHPTLNDLQSRLQLTGWSESSNRQAWEPQKGAIICAFHVGAYRYLASDLLLQGLPTCQPLERNAITRAENHILRDLPEKYLANVSLIDIGIPTAVFALARALRQGHYVLAYVDGNTGSDGRWGDKDRSEVRFFGHTLRVKHGLPRLAQRLGVPLIPVATPFVDTDHIPGSRPLARVEFGAPVIPPAQNDESARQAFVAEAMQTLYSYLESVVRQYPLQWESVGSLHRWLQPSLRTSGASQYHRQSSASPAVREPDAASMQWLDDVLKTGGCFRIDPARAVPFVADHGGAPTWLDVDRVCALRIGGFGAEALAALEFHSGIDDEWIQTHAPGPSNRQALLQTLATLREHGLIRSV